MTLSADGDLISFIASLRYHATGTVTRYSIQSHCPGTGPTSLCLITAPWMVERIVSSVNPLLDLVRMPHSVELSGALLRHFLDAAIGITYLTCMLHITT